MDTPIGPDNTVVGLVNFAAIYRMSQICCNLFAVFRMYPRQEFLFRPSKSGLVYPKKGTNLSVINTFPFDYVKLPNTHPG